MHCRDKYDHNKRSFPEFLSEQEASLKPDAFLDCEDVILLYEEFLELNAEDYLSEEDKALCATPPSELENRNYFDVCSPPEQISSEGSMISLTTM